MRRDNLFRRQCRIGRRPCLPGRRQSLRLTASVCRAALTSFVMLECTNCTLVHIHCRWNMYGPGSAVAHTRQGQRADSASMSVHILATTTQVRRPPGAHEFNEVGESVHCCAHSFRGYRQRWNVLRKQGTNVTGASVCPRSAEYQGSSGKSCTYFAHTHDLE